MSLDSVRSAGSPRVRERADPDVPPPLPNRPISAAVSRAGYAWAMAKQDDETYRDQAGRRRRRHLASPEERDARDAEARRLRAQGLSFRQIAQQLGWGRGTVERAVGNAPPPNRLIRGERIDGRPVVTIDGQPFPWHDAPDVSQWSPTGIEWGHFGAGSKRLAFTILLAVTDPHEAHRYAPSFAAGCLERIGPESEPWVLTTDEVRDWLAKSREMRGLDPAEALLLEVKPVRRQRR